MEIRYKLLGDGSGIILTRRADVSSEELSVFFDGAPDGATAIFQNERGNTYYRELSNGSCTAPVSNMLGATAVSVAVLNEGGSRFFCEGIFARALKNGEILVAPDDMNLPDVVASLRVENQALHEAIDALAELPDKVERVLARVKDLERKTQIIM